ncbi:uncharacterized protein ALTATR162_LOCUS1129 [Alternaria atra]|uniref:Uncharacterized protein n=1 Tax=Alternaria atra TaxID=119953 RepID=A0A8J2HTL4_9PLEO|nr:uncharacterized protein ALTATR162_LOCUS1129 [Alternaria atra]CAG5142324.1 unnamed protein product [Alternaria atra]
MPDGRHALHTPSNSAGSVKSHASSLAAAAGMERIYLMSDDESEDQPVTSIRGPGKYNLIGDQVVFDRGFGASQVGVEELIPVQHQSGKQRLVTVKRAVNITWRRRNELRSRLNTFYVVPADMLDSDVLLASDEYSAPNKADTSVTIKDAREAHPPQGRYAQGFGRVEEIDPTMPPHMPTAQTYPSQQFRPSPNIQRAYDSTHATRDSQREPVAGSSAPAAHSRHRDHPQPTDTTTFQVPQAPSSSQIQVTGLWDNTPIKMTFDPDASGEAFYQAFHQWAVRRERDGDLERQRMTLFIKASKSTSEKEAFDLCLEEGELEELWETAVEYIQDNKRSKAPHLYVTVKMDAG